MITGDIWFDAFVYYLLGRTVWFVFKLLLFLALAGFHAFGIIELDEVNVKW